MRALGGADSLELDDVSIDLIYGEVFLLCSDGLSNEVSASAIEQAPVSECRGTPVPPGPRVPISTPTDPAILR